MWVCLQGGMNKYKKNWMHFTKEIGFSWSWQTSIMQVFCRISPLPTPTSPGLTLFSIFFGKLSYI